MPRTATIKRQTGETNIELSLNLDGTGEPQIASVLGFFDHMLTMLSRHSLIDLTVTAQADMHVDFHHMVEDTGIVFGKVKLAVCEFASMRMSPRSAAPPLSGRRVADANFRSAAFSTSSRVGLMTSRSIATCPSKLSRSACGATVSA